MQSNLAKQKTSTEKGDTRNSYSGSKTSENLYDTPEHSKPDSDRGWSAFNRQFANKTSIRKVKFEVIKNKDALL